MIVLISIILLLCIVLYQEAFSNKMYHVRINTVQSVQYLRQKFLEHVSEDTGRKAIHTWYRNMDGHEQYHIDKLSDEVSNHIAKLYNTNMITFIPDMTEINVSGKEKKNSDKIYFTRHFDAPFAITPCKIIRVLVGINGTADVDTVFNDGAVNIQSGHAVIFDYNRSSHYIKLKTVTDGVHGGVQKDPRITLKMQFVIANDSKICKNVHRKWATVSRKMLEDDQNNLTLKTKIGIIASYLATYMHYILMLCLVIYFVKGRHVILKVIFWYMYMFVVAYYIFSLSAFAAMTVA